MNMVIKIQNRLLPVHHKLSQSLVSEKWLKHKKNVIQIYSLTQEKQLTKASQLMRDPSFPCLITSCFRTVKADKQLTNGIF